MNNAEIDAVNTALDDAKATEAKLQGKRADALKALAEIDDQRSAHAYDAHVQGGAAAKTLADLDKRRETVVRDIETIEVALAEAGRRVAAAERAEAHARLAANGEAAKVIADRLLERAEKVDKAFESARAELESFKTDMDELHGLGLSHPTSNQFRVHGGLALSTALMGLPLKSERDHLAPRERRSFTDLATGWRTQIHNWAAALSDKEAA